MLIILISAYFAIAALIYISLVAALKSSDLSFECDEKLVSQEREFAAQTMIKGVENPYKAAIIPALLWLVLLLAPAIYRLIKRF
jgi:hypothetical protein